MEKYENELKKILSSITKNVHTYYGEFSSLNDIKIDVNKMPAIYIDLVGVEPKDTYFLTLNFNLYLVGASFSQNEITREQKKYDIYSLIEKVHKALISSSILDSNLITIKSSKKILDAKAINAYLVIFQQSISFNIRQAYLIEGDIENEE